MLLSQITLHNFAAFDGTQTLNLSGTGNSKHNIVLIGAMNGSGKTTLLDAVKLCLYGAKNSGLLGARQSEPDFISDRLNFNARERSETEMWVDLTFDGVEQPGATHQIQIRRTWRFHSLRGAYEEDTLSIHKDGKPVEFVGRENWPGYIEELMPSGVADFFFFDGEKIQQLAEDEDDRQILKDAIRNLLGLTVFSLLGKDLSILTDRVRRDADKVTDDQLKQLEADIARLERERRENAEAREDLCRELYNLNDKDEDLEREVRRVAGVGADSRDDLQRELAGAEERKRTYNEQTLKLAGEFLPFAVAGKICEDLRQQIEAEERLISWEASKTTVHPQLQQIIDRVFNAPSRRPQPDITPPQRAFYQLLLADEWEALFMPRPSDVADEILHEISSKEKRQILSTLERVSVHNLSTLKDVLKMRESASQRTQDIARGLRSLPEDNSHLAELFNSRRSNEARKQQINREIGKIDDDAARLERDIKTADEKIENLNGKLKVANFDRRKVELSRRVQKVIDHYEAKLQERKLAELESLTTDMYRRLARKGDFVGEVKIDPRSYEVTVHDPHGKVVSKKSLSAGEKQIYAISLLWGLAQASNADLPIIIDTPFARLDSEHRTNIAKHYFPHASEQVIILSTDEEIDHRYVEMLRASIGRSYTIHHNNVARCSTFQEGYFPFIESGEGAF